MVGKFWSEAEDYYFFNTIIPLSHYASGENVRNSGQDWKVLAVKMQNDLDASGESQRTYAGQMLFQQYNRRFSSVAEARGVASPLVLAARALEARAARAASAAGPSQPSASINEDPASSPVGVDEENDGDALFIPSNDEDGDDDDDDEEENPASPTNAPKHKKPTTVTHKKRNAEAVAATSSNKKRKSKEVDGKEESYLYDIPDIMGGHKKQHR